MGPSMTDLQKLREPFPDDQIGKLPRVWCSACREAGKGRTCQEHRTVRCDVCGQKGTSAHSHDDFVGHAEVTDRLLSVDPLWTWEPMGFAPDGTPAVVTVGKELNLWIRLTVGGVTRPGVGIVAAGKTDVHKQLISDALKNAAMRFGVALDLWAKSELDHSSAGPPAADSTDQPTVDGGSRADSPSPAPVAETSRSSVPERMNGDLAKDGGAVPATNAPSSGGSNPPAASGAASISRDQGETTPPQAAVAASKNDAPAGGDPGGDASVGEVSASPSGQPDVGVLQLLLDLQGLRGKARAEALGEKSRLGITDLESLDPESEQFKLLRAKVSGVMGAGV